MFISMRQVPANLKERPMALIILIDAIRQAFAAAHALQELARLRAEPGRAGRFFTGE